MQVAHIDIIQQRILREINIRERLILETYKNLRLVAVENELFKNVLDDYDIHFYNIKKNKEQLLNELNDIHNYLENSIMQASVLNKQSELLKNDQRKIITKLAKIKEEIQEFS